MAYKKETVDKFGNYDPKLRYCEDLDLWLRWIKKGVKFTCINEELIEYSMPSDVRTKKNWIKNLSVRLKNFGSPSLYLSIKGIAIIFIFLLLPLRLKKMIYSYVRL